MQQYGFTGSLNRNRVPVLDTCSTRPQDYLVPTAPRTLDELRAIHIPLEQAAAAGAYIAAGQSKLTQARDLRDEAIATALNDHGPTAVARACGVSVSHVKAVGKVRR